MLNVHVSLLYLVLNIVSFYLQISLSVMFYACIYTDSQNG